MVMIVNEIIRSALSSDDRRVAHTLNTFFAENSRNIVVNVATIAPEELEGTGTPIPGINEWIIDNCGAHTNYKLDFLYFSGKDDTCYIDVQIVDESKPSPVVFRRVYVGSRIYSGPEFDPSNAVHVHRQLVGAIEKRFGKRWYLAPNTGIECREFEYHPNQLMDVSREINSLLEDGCSATLGLCNSAKTIKAVYYVGEIRHTWFFGIDELPHEENRWKAQVQKYANGYTSTWPIEKQVGAGILVFGSTTQLLTPETCPVDPMDDALWKTYGVELENKLRRVSSKEYGYCSATTCVVDDVCYGRIVLSDAENDTERHILLFRTIPEDNDISEFDIDLGEALALQLFGHVDDDFWYRDHLEFFSRMHKASLSRPSILNHYLHKDQKPVWYEKEPAGLVGYKDIVKATQRFLDSFDGETEWWLKAAQTNMDDSGLADFSIYLAFKLQNGKTYGTEMHYRGACRYVNSSVAEKLPSVENRSLAEPAFLMSAKAVSTAWGIKCPEEWHYDAIVDWGRFNGWSRVDKLGRQILFVANVSVH
ncbi:TPA: hypothetical protein ACTPQ1_004747 [Salmonella enterica]